MIRFAVFSYLFILTQCENGASRLVYLDQGPVRGFIEIDADIYSFYGIPYAKAPTGLDRFKAPLPAPVWTNILDAEEKEIVCPQTNLMGTLSPSKILKEDCLLANIFVPVTNETNLPVVIYVHGGAFMIGWGNMFTPKNIVNTKKIIAVTFNYRLGPHGFLCLGTKVAPGNAGMKDQVALIRWVKRNIVKFGGNPDEITISGYSAGATSVSILMLSPMTTGLFKKVIPESAGSLGAFSVQIDPIANAKEYARLLNFDNVDDICALQQFYMNASYEFLNSGQAVNRTNSISLMAPCIERDIGEERFLIDSPINILKTGKFEKLPVLYGFTDTEGVIRLSQFQNWKDRMNDKFSDFVPVDLQFKNKVEEEEVSEQIRRFYFGNKLVSEDTILQYIDYFTDVLFVYPVLRSIKYQVEAGHDQVYLYKYSFVEDNIPVVPYTNKRVPNHCAQSFTILDGFWNDTIVDEKDVSEEMKERKIFMKQIWLNFILTGKPTLMGSVLPDWPPVSKDWSPYMSINRTVELRESSVFKDRTLFWEKIYDQYYQYPMPPASLPECRRLKGKKKLN